METIYTFQVTSDDIATVEKLIEIKNRGYMADSNIVTSLYNRLLNKNAKPTSCSSCIRARIQELENWYKRYKEKLELNAQEAPSEAPDAVIEEPVRETTTEKENEAPEAKKQNKKAKKK